MNIKQFLLYNHSVMCNFFSFNPFYKHAPACYNVWRVHVFVYKKIKISTQTRLEEMQRTQNGRADFFLNKVRFKAFSSCASSTARCYVTIFCENVNAEYRERVACTRKRNWQHVFIS
jgi:hypothetical protein